MFSIFTKLGGEDAALEVIAKAVGEKPRPKTVEKWKTHGRIPPLNAVHLLDEYNRRMGWTGASYEGDCIAPRVNSAQAAE